MAKTITLAFLFERFSRLQDAVKQWEHDESPETHARWGMATIKIISDRLRSEIESFLDLSADQGKDVAPDARPLIMAIDTFALAYAAYTQDCSSGSESPRRTDGLWIALNRIAEVANQKFVSRKPQSIAILFKQGVTFNQIAMIYGWLLEDGSPDGQKVFEELDIPGTHYDPEKWVNPADKSRLARIDAEWALRPCKRAVAYVRPAQELPNTTWVPPSIKVMIAAGAPAEQIASVHNMTAEQAQDLINEAFEARLAEEAESNLASREVTPVLPDSSSTTNGQLSGV
jgi:hypothetical protein